MRALIATTSALASVVAIAGCGDDAMTPAPDAGPSLWFEDVAAEAGVDFTRRPVDDYLTVPDRIGGGVCVLDVDGVSPLDLFFPARRGQSSALYVGRGVLDYIDEAAARGLDAPGDAMGCLAYDIEGDGDTDLLVTGLGMIAWFENDGGTFSALDVALDPPVDPRDIYTSASAGDIDGDGDVDVFVAGYERFDPDALPADCGALPCAADILALAPIASRVFVRQGGGYIDQTATVAPELLDPAPTFVVSIVDVDGDDVPELVEWNDLGNTYHNRPLARGADGVFRGASATLGLDVTRRGTGGDTMGWATGDIDGDGRFDHVTSDYHAAATAVFFCGDAGCFDDAPGVRTTATSRSFRFGVALLDVDLDGDLDLFEATGHLVTTEENRARGYEDPREQAPNLLRWSGSRFDLIDPGATDALSASHVGRGVAIVDLDDDGRLDVVESTADGPAVVLRNVRPTEGHHLRIRLEGAGDGADAIGAVVTVVSGDTRYVRKRVAGEGFLGSFDPRLHFGLPDDAPVTVAVRFVSGRVVRLEDVEVDTEVVVREIM